MLSGACGKNTKVLIKMSMAFVFSHSSITQALKTMAKDEQLASIQKYASQSEGVWAKHLHYRQIMASCAQKPRGFGAHSSPKSERMFATLPPPLCHSVPTATDSNVDPNVAAREELYDFYNMAPSNRAMVLDCDKELDKCGQELLVRIQMARSDCRWLLSSSSSHILF